MNKFVNENIDYLFKPKSDDQIVDALKNIKLLLMNLNVCGILY